MAVVPGLDRLRWFAKRREGHDAGYNFEEDDENRDAESGLLHKQFQLVVSMHSGPFRSE